MQDAANLMREFAQNGASGSSGRPSMPEPFAVQIAHWLREDPDVSGAEIYGTFDALGITVARARLTNSSSGDGL